MKTRKIYKFVQTHLCSMHSIDHGTDTNITIQYALYIDVPIFVSIYSIHLQYIHLSTVLFIYLIWLCIFIKYIYIHSLCTSYSYWLNTEFSQDWCQASLAVSKEGVQLKTKAYIAPEGFLANITDPTGANQFFVWKLASSEIWFKPFERN